MKAWFQSSCPARDQGSGYEEGELPGATGRQGSGSMQQWQGRKAKGSSSSKAAWQDSVRGRSAREQRKVARQRSKEATAARQHGRTAYVAGSERRLIKGAKQQQGSIAGQQVSKQGKSEQREAALC
eukprot:scaffold156650_cov19-Tisochrysis_lutea.AAC.1